MVEYVYCEKCDKIMQILPESYDQLNFSNNIIEMCECEDEIKK